MLRALFVRRFIGLGVCWRWYMARTETIELVIIRGREEDGGVFAKKEVAGCFHD